MLRYLSRLSGPFLDRFDLSLEIPLLPGGSLSQKQQHSETSAQVRARVLAARAIQMARAGKVNAQLSNPEIARDCVLQQQDAEWLEEILNALGLSVRAWQHLKGGENHRRFSGERQITRQHLQEAVGYRSIDRLLIYLHKARNDNGAEISPVMLSSLSLKSSTVSICGLPPDKV